MRVLPTAFSRGRSLKSRSNTRPAIGLSGRRRRDEKGSVLVEFALVAPLVLLLLFGMIEFGFILKDSLTLDNLTRIAARTGADAGNSTSPDADYQILSAIKGSAGGLTSNIQGVIIFNADWSGTPSNALPPQCKVSATGGVPGLCNVYTPAQMSNLEPTWQTQQSNDPSSFDCTPNWDEAWCPSSRVVSQSLGPSYLGVYISALHSNVTGMFHSMTLSDTSVVRLEPQTL